MDNNIMVILNGRYIYSKTVAALAGKINQYGESRNIEAILKSSAHIVKCIYYKTDRTYEQKERKKRSNNNDNYNCVRVRKACI